MLFGVVSLRAGNSSYILKGQLHQETGNLPQKQHLPQVYKVTVGMSSESSKTQCVQCDFCNSSRKRKLIHRVNIHNIHSPLCWRGNPVPIVHLTFILKEGKENLHLREDRGSQASEAVIPRKY